MSRLVAPVTAYDLPPGTRVKAFAAGGGSSKLIDGVILQQVSKGMFLVRLFHKHRGIVEKRVGFNHLLLIVTDDGEAMPLPPAPNPPPRPRLTTVAVGDRVTVIRYVSQGQVYEVDPDGRAYVRFGMHHEWFGTFSLHELTYPPPP